VSEDEWERRDDEYARAYDQFMAGYPEPRAAPLTGWDLWEWGKSPVA
jgi:hypothetical protein